MYHIDNSKNVLFSIPKNNNIIFVLYHFKVPAVKTLQL